MPVGKNTIPRGFSWLWIVKGVSGYTKQKVSGRKLTHWDAIKRVTGHTAMVSVLKDWVQVFVDKGHQWMDAEKSQWKQRKWARNQEPKFLTQNFLDHVCVESSQIFYNFRLPCYVDLWKKYNCGHESPCK